MQYVYLRYPEGKYKAVTLSYDDGCHDDMRFSDVITPTGLKCTFNLTNRSVLTPEQVKAYILDRGHEVAVHGANHRAPGFQRPIDGIRDVLDCRLKLEKDYDRIIRGMAYPDSGITKFLNGASYENIKSYLTDLGIVYARTLAGDNDSFLLPTDWHAWMPTVRHANPLTLEWIDKFNAISFAPNTYCSARYPRLFYLWGHSFEFERAGNWDLLDRICEKLAGHQDVWYATNMEIYDYVTAYHSLVWSADNTMLHNPTLRKIWLEIDGQLITIESGETLRLS